MKEYQRKRAIFIKVIPMCFVVFFIAVVTSFFTDDLEWLRGILAAASILLAITVQLAMNTCPNCNRSQFRVIKTKGKIIRTASWELNPMSCPWCDEKLNEP
jgi:hypothetical protein